MHDNNPPSITKPNVLWYHQEHRINDCGNPQSEEYFHTVTFAKRHHISSVQCNNCVHNTRYTVYEQIVRKRIAMLIIQILYNYSTNPM
jgi:hypothetical protein